MSFCSNWSQFGNVYIDRHEVERKRCCRFIEWCRTRCTEPFPLFSILFRSIRSHRLDFLFLFITWPIRIVLIIAYIIAKIVVAIAWICYPPTRNSRRISTNSCKITNPKKLWYLITDCYWFIYASHFTHAFLQMWCETGRCNRPITIWTNTIYSFLGICWTKHIHIRHIHNAESASNKTIFRINF